MILLTGLGVTAAIFREGYLRKGFNSTMLCAGAGVVLYELLLFAMGLFLKLVSLKRLGAFALTGGLSVVAILVIYPVLVAISKIGGETWKE